MDINLSVKTLFKICSFSGNFPLKSMIFVLFAVTEHFLRLSIGHIRESGYNTSPGSICILVLILTVGSTEILK